MNTVYMKALALTLSILWMAVAVQAGTDTTKIAESKKPTWKATARIHSMGLFSYGGRLVSQNTVADFHFVYQHRTWGFQFFKAADLGNGHSPINFAMAVFNRPFHFSDKLTLTPHVGVVLEQFESLADHGSDAAAMLTLAYRLHPRVTLEHTALLANLVMEPELRDWVNRLRLLYSYQHLDVTLFAWHNNAAFDAQEYATLGLSVFLSRMKLAGPVRFQVGLTGLYLASASDESARVNANGVFATLGMSIH